MIPILIGIILTLAVAAAALAFLALRWRKKYMQARQQRKQLAKAVSTQRRSLKNMSHKVRTPMNAICGFAQILSNKQMLSILTERDLTEYGQIIQSNTELLASLIDNILDLGNMDEGQAVRTQVTAR